MVLPLITANVKDARSVKNWLRNAPVRKKKVDIAIKTR
jgi:hypothetical protein